MARWRSVPLYVFSVSCVRFDERERSSVACARRCAERFLSRRLCGSPVCASGSVKSHITAIRESNAPCVKRGGVRGSAHLNAFGALPAKRKEREWRVCALGTALKKTPGTLWPPLFPLGLKLLQKGSVETNKADFISPISYLRQGSYVFTAVGLCLSAGLLEKIQNNFHEAQCADLTSGGTGYVLVPLGLMVAL